MTSRNFNDPQYKEWRKKVFGRDRFRCRWPGCGSRRRLNAHHIRRWADHPALRYVLGNGVTLCRVHHQSVWGREDDYIALFLRIVAGTSGSALLALIAHRHAQEKADRAAPDPTD